MKHPIEKMAGKIVARCTRIPAHSVELMVVPESDGGLSLWAKCACSSSSGAINTRDVLRLIDERKPIEYDIYVLTME